MTEAFNSSKQPNPETIKLETVDRDGNESMQEWEISHSSGDMVYLRQYSEAGDEARAIYRGMSRARFAELGGTIAEEPGDEVLNDAMRTMRDATAKMETDAREILKQSRQNQEAIMADHRATIAERDRKVAEIRRDRTPFTSDETLELFSYEDVKGPDGVDWEGLEANPRVALYGQELMELAEKHGRKRITKLSGEIRSDYEAAASKLNFERSDTSVEKSKSWIVWDIAKQSYLAKHPEESNEHYKLGDPFDPAYRTEKVREISSRHLGWEFGEAMMAAGDKAIRVLSDDERSTPEANATHSHAQYDFISSLTSDETRDKIVALYGAHDTPLPSYVLTEIGELLREAVDETGGEKKIDLDATRRSMVRFGTDRHLTREQSRELIEGRLDELFDGIIEQDSIAYPDKKANRSVHGIPHYIPDGFMDLGITAKQNPADRVNIPIRYVDKRAILEKYKDVFVEVYQKTSLDNPQAGRDSAAVDLVSRRILESMPVRGKDDNQKLESIQSLSTLESANSEERALVAQVLFQALGIESRMVRTFSAFKREIEEKGIENAVGSKRAINFVKFGDDWHIVDVSHPAHTRNWESAIYKIGDEPDEPTSSKPSEGQIFVVGGGPWKRKYTTRRNSYWTIKRNK